MAGPYDELDAPYQKSQQQTGGGGIEALPPDTGPAPTADAGPSPYGELDALNPAPPAEDPNTRNYFMARLEKGSVENTAGNMRALQMVAPTDYLKSNLGGGAEYYQKKGEEITSQMSPEDQARDQKPYFTTDASNAAWADPKRMAGDLVASVPAVGQMLAGGAISRGLGMASEAIGLAGGQSAEQAYVQGLKVAAKTQAAGMGVAMGSVSFGQSYNSSHDQVMKMQPAQLAQSPKYLDYLRQGYTPDVAKELLANDFAMQSGAIGGTIGAVMGGVGAGMMGEAATNAASGFTAMARSAAIDASVTGIQGGVTQLGENVAARTSGVDPYRDLDQNVGEATVAGVPAGVAPGAAFGLTQKMAHSTARSIDNINRQARSQQMQNDTGLNIPQTATAPSFQRNADAKPLTPIQEQIRQQAVQMGLDPDIALSVAHLESSDGTNAGKNPNSSAHGVFQMIDSTWNQMGGGDRNDVNTQIVNGVKNLTLTTEYLKTKLGRDPTPAEVYAGQMFGPEGAARFIRADDDTLVVDHLMQTKNITEHEAEVIAQNNGLSGMTVGEAMEHFADRMGSAETARGGHMDQTATARAGDDASARAAQALDDSALALHEIDSETQKRDASALSDDEARAAEHDKRNQDAVEGQDKDEIDQNMDHALNAVTPDVAGHTDNPSTPAPTLPMELKTTPANYTVGKDNYNIHFESDTDRALFMVGRKKARDKNDAQYLKFLLDNEGLTEPEARARGNDLVKSLPESVDPNRVPQKGTTGELHVAAKDVQTPRGQNEAFVSRDEMQSRRTRPNSNDKTTLGETPILAGKNEGKLLRDALPEAGEVVGVAHDGNSAAPAPYVKASTDTLQKWVQRFAPNAKVLLTFRTRDNNNRNVRSTAWYQRGPLKLGKDVFQINARPLYRHGMGESSSMNQTTQLKAGYSLAHEFGHLLMDVKLMDGLNKVQHNTIDKLEPTKLFTEVFLQTLPADKLAVMRVYNDLKRQVLNNEISPTEFARRWLSPWKLAHGWNTKQGIESFANMFLGDSWEGYTTNQMALALDIASKILSPHEYMAEQMAKYAYDQKLLEKSPLGVRSFFKNALATMRDFFKTMKGNKEIGAGVEFKKWLEDGTSITAGMNESAKPRVMTESTMPKPRVTPKARKEAAPLVTENLEPPVTPPPMETMASAMGDAPPERPGQSSHWIQDPADEKGRWNLGNTGYKILAWQDGFRVYDPRNNWAPADTLEGARAYAEMKAAEEPTPGEPPAPTETPVAALGEGLAPGDPLPYEPSHAEFLRAQEMADSLHATTEEVASAKATLEQITSARKIMGVKEMIQLKRNQPEAVAEVRDLINTGQLDAARDTVEELLGPDVATKMRWDLDDVTDQIFAETQRNAEQGASGREAKLGRCGSG